MLTTVATLGIALRNSRIQTRSLKGLKYLRNTGDFIGNNLTLRLLRRTLVLDAPCKSTEDAENKLRGLILTVGNKVRKLSVEVGILSEDVACNLRGIL